MTVQLRAIGIHPVKSTAIRHVLSAEVMPWGLAGDRRWMVVDGDGRMVSARELHELFTITADTAETIPLATAALRLSSPGHDPIDVAEPQTDPLPVRLHGHDLLGLPADEGTQAWVRKVLARDDITLVWCDDPTRRSLNPSYARPGDHTAYADGYPLTLATEASLRRLDDWIAEDALARGETAPAAMEMARFRPNLVVDGDEPFAEDGWTHVVVGDVRLRMAKPNARCVITTIDPGTLATGKEPIRSLARHRLVDHKTLFAVNVIPETTGTISVGDPVTVLA
jgi:uncharacterized protein